MKAMILCAGRGERLRPLTDDTPKPLLEAGGKPLLGYLIESLASAGVNQLVVNISWLAGRFRLYFESALPPGMTVKFSEEGDIALETGGGIQQALPLLGDEPFIVVNGDIWTDFPFATLALAAGSHAHLVLARNPSHNRGGDFCLRDSEVCTGGKLRHTYTGIGVYAPEFFAGCERGRFPLVPMIERAVDLNKVTGELYQGAWFDVGTKERLQQLDAFLRQKTV